MKTMTLRNLNGTPFVPSFPHSRPFFLFAFRTFSSSTFSVAVLVLTLASVTPIWGHDLESDTVMSSSSTSSIGKGSRTLESREDEDEVASHSFHSQHHRSTPLPIHSDHRASRRRPDCPPPWACEGAACREPLGCAGRYGLDACGCCHVCFRVLNQTCGGGDGDCDEGLRCEFGTKDDEAAAEEVGICVQEEKVKLVEEDNEWTEDDPPPLPLLEARHLGDIFQTPPPLWAASTTDDDDDKDDAEASWPGYMDVSLFRPPGRFSEDNLFDSQRGRDDVEGGDVEWIPAHPPESSVHAEPLDDPLYRQFEDEGNVGSWQSFDASEAPPPLDLHAHRHRHRHGEGSLRHLGRERGSHGIKVGVIDGSTAIVDPSEVEFDKKQGAILDPDFPSSEIKDADFLEREDSTQTPPTSAPPRSTAGKEDLRQFLAETPSRSSSSPPLLPATSESDDGTDSLHAEIDDAGKRPPAVVINNNNPRNPSLSFNDTARSAARVPKSWLQSSLKKVEAGEEMVGGREGEKEEEKLGIEAEMEADEAFGSRSVSTGTTGVSSNREDAEATEEESEEEEEEEEEEDKDEEEEKKEETWELGEEKEKELVGAGGISEEAATIPGEEWKEGEGEEEAEIRYEASNFAIPSGARFSADSLGFPENERVEENLERVDVVHDPSLVYRDNDFDEEFDDYDDGENDAPPRDDYVFRPWDVDDAFDVPLPRRRPLRPLLPLKPETSPANKSGYEGELPVGTSSAASSSSSSACHGCNIINGDCVCEFSCELGAFTFPDIQLCENALKMLTLPLIHSPIPVETLPRSGAAGEDDQPIQVDVIQGDCDVSKCPEDSLVDPSCPHDSVLRVVHHQPDECCPRQRVCDCDFSLCLHPVCPEGHSLVIIHEGFGRPGQCCSVMHCEEADESCVAANGMLYGHGEFWHESACVQCTCEKGEKLCRTETCHAPCERPRYVPGACCPICPPEGAGPPAETECDIECPHGFVTNNRGKEKCECAAPPTPPPTCPPLLNCKKTCAYGFRKNRNGCEKCRCNKCPPMDCRAKCLLGFQVNNKGCQICKCVEPEIIYETRPPTVDPTLMTTTKTTTTPTKTTQRPLILPPPHEYPLALPIDPRPQQPHEGRGCVSDGVVYDDGDNWFDGCRRCFCDDGKEMCALIMCRVPQCPYTVIKKGECCPSCYNNSSREATSAPLANRTVCHTTDGIFRVEGETWQMGLCTQCTCYGGMIMCETEKCPPILCERPIMEPNGCCPKCPKVALGPPPRNAKHKKCFSESGKVYHHGETWRSEPCLSCACHGGSVCFRHSCPPLKCNRPLLGKGQCCPTCPTNTDNPTKSCEFEGKIYGTGDSWQINDCIFCNCTLGNTLCMKKVCSVQCEDAVKVPGKCCPTCPPAPTEAQKAGEAETYFVSTVPPMPALPPQQRIHEEAAEGKEGEVPFSSGKEVRLSDHVFVTGISTFAVVFLILLIIIFVLIAYIIRGRRSEDATPPPLPPKIGIPPLVKPPPPPTNNARSGSTRSSGFAPFAFRGGGWRPKSTNVECQGNVYIDTEKLHAQSAAGAVVVLGPVDAMDAVDKQNFNNVYLERQNSRDSTAASSSSAPSTSSSTAKPPPSPSPNNSVISGADRVHNPDRERRLNNYSKPPVPPSAAFRGPGGGSHSGQHSLKSRQLSNASSSSSPSVQSSSQKSIHLPNYQQS